MTLTNDQLANLLQLATLGLQTLADRAGLAQIQAHLQAEQAKQQDEKQPAEPAAPAEE